MTPSLAAVAGLTAMAALSLWAGVLARRRGHTTSDLMVAARAVRPHFNAAAISGEYLSAASFLGIAGLVMQFGYDVLWYPVCYAAGYLLLLLFIAGPLRRFGAYTIPDFAEGRFDSPRFRRLAVGLVLVIGLFYTLPQMKAAGLTVQAASGLPYGVGIGVVTVVVVSAVISGGMRGITLVQGFQFAVKLFAITVPIFALLAVLGGPQTLLREAGRQPLPRLPQATTFSVRPGELWVLPAADAVRASSPIAARWLGRPPTALRSQAPSGFVGTPTSALPPAGSGRALTVRGRMVLPAGRILWQGSGTVRLARGAPVPFGDATPPSSTARWLQPFGPLAGGSGHPLLFTYSLIMAILLGTIGLPHILVRFYTNPDARAARRTALLVLVLLGGFYLWPPLYGLIGRLRAPQLYTSNLTDAVVLVLPRQVPPPWLGQLLSAVIAAGAFAAFASTLSGLLVSLAGALGHDIYGRWWHPEAGPRARRRAFRVGAALAALVAAGLGLLVAPFDISILVGWAFAIAASSFFPLLVLGLWWRRLTLPAAAIGVAVGGGCATGAIVTTMVAAGAPPLQAFLARHSELAVVLAQPAVVTVPLAFLCMVAISLARPRPPAAVGAKMLQMHAPERLGLRRDYIPN